MFNSTLVCGLKAIKWICASAGLVWEHLVTLTSHTTVEACITIEPSIEIIGTHLRLLLEASGLLHLSKTSPSHWLVIELTLTHIKSRLLLVKASIELVGLLHLIHLVHLVEVLLLLPKLLLPKLLLLLHLVGLHHVHTYHWDEWFILLLLLLLLLSTQVHVIQG